MSWFDLSIVAAICAMVASRTRHRILRRSVLWLCFAYLLINLIIGSVEYLTFHFQAN